MLLNYLKLSICLLLRNPFFTFINVLGLSIGTAVFIILWQYSQHELNSNHSAKDYEQIYRACTRARWTDDKVKWEEKIMSISAFRIDRVIGLYQEILDKTHFYSQQLFRDDITNGHGREIYMTCLDKNNERQRFPESKVIYAAPNLFEFFTIPLVKRTADNALSLSESMVIAEAIARKYFGNDDPVGKTILLKAVVTHLNFSDSRFS